jgi:hypothetical protein
MWCSPSTWMVWSSIAHLLLGVYWGCGMGSNKSGCTKDCWLCTAGSNNSCCGAVLSWTINNDWSGLLIVGGQPESEALSMAVLVVFVAYLLELGFTTSIFSFSPSDEIRSICCDLNHLSSLPSQTMFLRGFLLHWESVLYGFEHWKVWCLYSHLFFLLCSSKSKYFWQELQQRLSGMPNSTQLLIHLKDILVISFCAFFGSVVDTSSNDSVGWERFLRRVEGVMVAPTWIYCCCRHRFRRRAK